MRFGTWRFCGWWALLIVPQVLWAQPAHTPAQTAQIAYRIQPGIDWISDLTTDAMMSFSVIEDRGIVAKSAEQGVHFPAQANLVNRQSVRHTTSAAAPDGSFTVDLAFLSKSAAVRDADGREHVVPDNTSLVGSRVQARALPDGRIDAGTMQITGAPEEKTALIRPVFLAMFEQMGALENVSLSTYRGASQRVELTLPIGGITSVAIGMDINYKLVDIKEDIAEIDMVYVMDFGTPEQPMRIKAHGSGAGAIRYDTQRQLILSTTDHSLMNMELEMPEGVIKVQVVNQQKQVARLAEAR
ncbi:MAG TPA: hypothetical protein VFY22_03730 [Hydrogenophaga sp.]|nr:hypothetical protein [Hydrogenophaga sp.]